MTIFTDRDLERVASLRTNWRREFLLEVVRLRRQREVAIRRARLPSATADDVRFAAECDRPAASPTVAIRDRSDI